MDLITSDSDSVGLVWDKKKKQLFFQQGLPDESDANGMRTTL